MISKEFNRKIDHSEAVLIDQHEFSVVNKYSNMPVIVSSPFYPCIGVAGFLDDEINTSFLLHFSIHISSCNGDEYHDDDYRNYIISSCNDFMEV